MRPIKSNDIPINHHVEQGDNQRRNDTIIANSFTRFPCNARGVGGSHTAFNAYFNVPSNCTHGTRFQCSQDDCRKSGRWFRYCLFCNSVTCDRNFNSQHYPRRACWMKKSDPNRNKRPTLERVGVDGESGACSLSYRGMYLNRVLRISGVTRPRPRPWRCCRPKGMQLRCRACRPKALTKRIRLAVVIWFSPPMNIPLLTRPQIPFGFTMNFLAQRTYLYRLIPFASRQ